MCCKIQTTTPKMVAFLNSACHYLLQPQKLPHTCRLFFPSSRNSSFLTVTYTSSLFTPQSHARAPIHFPYSHTNNARRSLQLTASAAYPLTETYALPDPHHRTIPVIDTTTNKVILKSMSLQELESWVETSLGEKKFRARQLYKWLYQKGAVSFDDMTDLSKSFRESLKQVAQVDCLHIDKVHQAADGTRKITYRLPGHQGGIIETVLIPSFTADNDKGPQSSTTFSNLSLSRKRTHRNANNKFTKDKAPDVVDSPDPLSSTTHAVARGRTKPRMTICVSSQLGCALNCQFCFTAKMGLRHSLHVGEIVDQVLLAKRFFEGEDPDMKIKNVVFMGMGEPFSNYANVIRAVDIMIDENGIGLSHNKVTVSTSGLVPEIKKFALESRANLAVSLNATTDEVRNWIMPINRKYNLESLMSCLREVFPRRNDKSIQHKVFFEYIMLKGVNDSLEDAKRILRLTAHIPCKLNLIHFNSHHGTEFQASDNETIAAFQDYLIKKGMLVTRRKSRGDEKMSACGQLGQPGDRPMPPRMRVPEKFASAVRIDNLDSRKEKTRTSN